MPRPRRRALFLGAAAAGAVVAAITAFTVLGLPALHRQGEVTMVPPDASPPRLNCAAQPSSCGYPDQSNTGVAAGTPLRASGSVFATEPGQVVEELSITGELVVAASGVTIRNVRIVGGRPVGNADWVIVIRPGVKDVLIENVDVGTKPGSEQDIACILNLGDAVPVVRHANLHGCTAGISSGGGVVEDSYIHDPSEVPGVSHIVGIASNGGGGLTVRHNTILNPFGQTAAVAFYQDFGTQSDNLVEDNLIAGGGYCFYGGTGDRGGTRDIRFIANRLSRKYSPDCGHFGVLASFAWNDPGNVFTGNFWDETGVEVVP